MTDIPYGNYTALNHEIVSGWELSAERRGTSDILYSCLVTITLCIYTAIHLNIPDPRETDKDKYLRLAKWVLIGIFGPEWVIFTAWKQWKDSRDFLKHIEEHADSGKFTESNEHGLSSVVTVPSNESLKPLPDEEGSYSVANSTKGMSGQYRSCPQTDSNSENHHVADMTYAFYATMGGFRVDVTDISDQIESIVLSQEALKQLVSAGGYRFIQIDSKLINDRSKANNLAKLLVCSQVAWMATQCIARKASGMPLTLLELHTFAHVLCALLIYIFWFKKPLSVNEATTITLPDQFRGEIAYAVGLRHEQSVAFNLGDQLRELGVSSPVHVTERSVMRASSLVQSSFQNFSSTISAELQPCRSACPASTHLSHEEQAHGMCVKYDPSEAENVLILSSNLGHSIRVEVLLTDRDKLRWRLSRSAIRAKTNKSLLLDREVLLAYSHTRRTTYPSDMANQYDGFFSRWLTILFGEVYDHLERAGVVHVLTIMCIPCAYGGIHLSAWHWRFPSEIELWMWRVSALCLAGAAPNTVLMVEVLTRFDDLDIVSKISEKLPTMVYEFLRFLWLGAAVLPWAITLCVYPFARIFLVIEAFLSLRTVPIGVYATIPWTQYIPHL